MSHYNANLRDIEFCLFDLLGREKVMGIAPYGDVDRDTSVGMLEEMKRLTSTRFIVITHNPVTMSRMDRLYGVTMPEQGVSQLVSVDLGRAQALAAE